MSSPDQSSPFSSPAQQVRGLVPSSFKSSIAVASGKGGVGKSTIAVNIAVSLAQNGAQVGLLDADIYGPNVPLMMGVDELPPQEGEKLVPARAHGVKVMSIGLFPGLQADQPLIWRGPMLHKAIRQFIGDVAWGELDYLVVDLPPGTGDTGLSLAQSMALTGGLIVTLPQQVSLDDARRGLEMFRQLDVNILGVVENMSFLELPDGSRMDVFGTGGGEKLAAEAGVSFIGAVPLDPAVREGGDTGTPVVISHPDSPVSRALKGITEQLAIKVAEIQSADKGEIPINLA